MTRLRAVVVVSWLLACTDVGVHDVSPEPLAPPDETIALEGSYCATDPATLTTRVNVMFIVDDSREVGYADKNFVRINAIKTLAAELATDADVAFGLIQMSDLKATALIHDPFYTSDLSVLTAALATNLHEPDGRLPYRGAINILLDAILTDIETSPASAVLTHYVTIFIASDLPSDSTNPDFADIKDLLSAIKNLEQVSPAAGRVTFHTAHLTGGRHDQAATANLLSQLAEIGDGRFQTFGGTITKLTGYDTTHMAIQERVYLPLFVANMNTRMSPGGIVIDSDQDGLSDDVEQAAQTNPSSRDTDGDGCSDQLEYKYTKWDPLTPGPQTDPPHCECETGSQTRDRDRDGLTDCEETWLSSNPLISDSDLNADGRPSPDHMVDRLEVAWSLSRTKWDANEDNDLDGVNNLKELSTHMDPNAHDNALREDFAYDYEYIAAQSEHPGCYEFRVSKIAVATKLKSEDTSSDQNALLIYFVEGDETASLSRTRVRFAEKIVDARPGQTITVTPDDFVSMEAR